MKQFYFFLVCLFASISMNAQDKVMTIDNQTPGWLSSKMTYAQQVAVEDLTITGYINPTDLEFVNGLIQKRNLKVLNLYDAVTIDEDNNDYYLWTRFVQTQGKILQKLVWPKKVKWQKEISVSTIDTLYIVCHNDTKVSGVIKNVVFMEGTDTIPQNGVSGGFESIKLPNSLKVLAYNPFSSIKLPESFTFPNGVVKIGIPLNGQYNYGDWYSWCYLGNQYNNVFPISKDRFDFPDSLKVYYSRGEAFVNSRSFDVFTSDTITVGEKCDSLFAKLNAKVACFYSKTPPKHYEYDYNIEKMYVPEGCVEVYKEACKRDYVGSILELKKMSEIVFLSQTSLLLQKGEKKELLYEIQPTDAFDKRIKWSSSNEEVATVDANGVVTAHKNGTATITVSSYDGSVTNSCEIIVAQPVTGVSIEPAEIEFHNLGDKAQLKAVFEPEDATNKNVTWKSSNESVCSISADGSIIATGYGKTVVLATTEDGNFVGTCIVVVTEASAIKQTSLSESGFKVIDRTIVFDDSNDVESQITTLGGALVYKGNAKRICLRSGMYLVKAGSKVRKVCIP